MFRKLIESANTIIQKLDKQGSAHLSTVPEEERVKWSELIGWETAAKSVIVRTFGTDSHQMKKWEGVLDFFAELNEIQRAESTYEPVQFNSQRMGQLLDLLIEFQTYVDMGGSDSLAPKSATEETSAVGSLGSSRNVFIVHGHDEAKKWELKNFLKELGVEPIILHEQDDLGMTIIEKFEHYAAQCNFAFVLLTPDDRAHDSLSSTESKWRARQNVIMELGWFMARIGRRRVVIIHRGNVEIPSDILGVLSLPFTDSVLEVSERMRKRLRGEKLIS